MSEELTSKKLEGITDTLRSLLGRQEIGKVEDIEYEMRELHDLAEKHNVALIMIARGSDNAVCAHYGARIDLMTALGEAIMGSTLFSEILAETIEMVQQFKREQEPDDEE